MSVVLQTSSASARANGILENDFRREFPIFANNPDICFLDSASTSQKPSQVLDAERRFLEKYYANIGRGSYSWADRTNLMVRSAREKIAHFIGGSCGEEVVFTAGATMALNLVPLAWGEYNLEAGDEILFCPSDHRSINEPWFLLRDRLLRRGMFINLKQYPLAASGGIDAAALLASVTNKTVMRRDNQPAARC